MNDFKLPEDCMVAGCEINNHDPLQYDIVRPLFYSPSKKYYYSSLNQETYDIWFSEVETSKLALYCLLEEPIEWIRGNVCVYVMQSHLEKVAPNQPDIMDNPLGIAAKPPFYWAKYGRCKRAVRMWYLEPIAAGLLLFSLQGRSLEFVKTLYGRKDRDGAYKILDMIITHPSLGSGIDLLKSAVEDCTQEKIRKLLDTATIEKIFS